MFLGPQGERTWHPKALSSCRLWCCKFSHNHNDLCFPNVPRACRQDRAKHVSEDSEDSGKQREAIQDESPVSSAASELLRRGYIRRRGQKISLNEKKSFTVLRSDKSQSSEGNINLFTV